MFLPCLLLTLMPFEFGVNDDVVSSSSQSIVDSSQTESDDSSPGVIESPGLVVVDNVDDIAVAVSDAITDDGIAVYAVSPGPDAGLWFKMSDETYFVPSNYAEYVKISKEAPYVVNTSSSNITLFTSFDDGYSYRLPPFSQMQRRYNTGSYVWENAPVATVSETNLLPQTWNSSQFYILIATILVLILSVVYSLRSK